MKTLRDIKYIVVQCVAPNRKDLRGNNYIVKTNGEIIRRNVSSKNTCIDHLVIGYLGRHEKNGVPKDSLSPNQETPLFNKIIALTERYPDAKIISGEEFYKSTQTSKGFNLKKWLWAYEPQLDLIETF